MTIADLLRVAFPDQADHVAGITDAPSRFSCHDVDTSMIFVYATWSVEARKALSRCIRLFGQYRDALSRLTIVNSECIDYDDFKQVAGFAPQGYGELLWIVRGKVVQAVSDWRTVSDEAVEGITRSLGFLGHQRGTTDDWST